VIQLSVVIPAFDEEGRIERTLQGAMDYLARRHPSFELLVVDDGSRDRTRELARRFEIEDTRVRVVSLPENLGKGAAVRHGVMASRGDRVLVMDADLATPMDELEKLSAALDRGADVAIGSRGMPGSELRRSQGKIRETMGKTFNAIVQRVVLSGIRDTQCGFKLWRGDVARSVFGEASVDRYAFDVETLLVALDRGLRVDEVAVAWAHDPDSKVSPVGDAAQMLVDVVRLRLKRGNRTRLP
jgi:dolichyl-phosphate beta-glucosyltransferase